MKVLLINPPYGEVYSKVKSAEGVNPPLGLAYIAAYLRENDVDVNILDAHALQIGLLKLESKMPKFDVVAVPSVTPSLSSSLEVLRIAKKINPHCKTIMGGPHISAIPVETMSGHPIIDFGIVGEAEVTILELVKTIQREGDYSSVKGIAYRKNGKINLNKRRPLIENIDELPFPAYDLLPFDKYQQHLHHVSLSKNIPIKPFAILFSSRGCPYNCSFCASQVIWQRKARFRSVDNVLAEIDMLVNEYNIKVLDIADDIFTMNKKRLYGILDGLIERNYDLHFNCLSRVDTLDKELLQKMKKAGCYLIRFGVESGNQEMLNRMHKNTSIEQIKRAFKLINKADIASSASFIIGHVGETKQSAEDTIKLAKEINPTLAHFFIAIPLPGTELYDLAKEKNLIIDENFDRWVQMPEMPAIRTEDLTPEDLIKLRRKAYKSFYFRPSYILRKLVQIRSLSQVNFYLRGVLAVRSLITRAS